MSAFLGGSVANNSRIVHSLIKLVKNTSKLLKNNKKSAKIREIRG
jgi:hypothetical protein